MIRIAVTSDLHFDRLGVLTDPEQVQRVTGEIADARPNAVVIAGDVGHPLDNFCACLDAFVGLGPHVGVVAGNHDVWRDPTYDSRSLWEEVLPRETRRRGLHWLEHDSIIIDRVAILGSMAWYDYSALRRTLAKDENFFAAVKSQVSNDAHWIDWAWSDLEMAGRLCDHLVKRLERCENDPSVDHVVIVTHVPVFEQQMSYGPVDSPNYVANAFFANFRTGEAILRFSKVRAVASGHLHLSIRSIVARPPMPEVYACVVGSDYGSPTWVMIEI